ncbi:hypothetical protein [Pseudoxanthomonas sp.]|jgi:hypothetical protein|uniref:hypothetical protein n=1 Tax=Pseudoxanthomonas sp. TaxID=1871049 RepID=UPI002E0EEAD7|nr:hypothetical protein [Pseudoxanthomonas sp.]
METQDAQRMQALLLDIVETQKRLLAQTARMLEIQQQEHDQARQQLGLAQSALLSAAGDMRDGGQWFATEALQAMEAQGQQVLARGLRAPLDEAGDRIDQTVQAMGRIGSAAGRQMAALAGMQRTVVVKSLLWLGLGGVSLAVGSSLWAWHAWRQAGQFAVEADLGQRIGRADLAKCGEGLCANVDLQGRGHGDRRQYRPVKARPEPEPAGN